MTAEDKFSALLKDISTRDGKTRDRRDLILECIWEIGALAQTLRGVVTPDETQAWLVVRGLSSRIEDVATVAGRLFDEQEDGQELVEMLRID